MQELSERFEIVAVGSGVARDVVRHRHRHAPARGGGAHARVEVEAQGGDRHQHRGADRQLDRRAPTGGAGEVAQPM